MANFQYDRNEPFWLNHARATILSDDLDPVYVAAYRARSELSPDCLHRFLVAMSLYYHIGFSCQIAEATTEETFWDYMIANYEGTKRGTERRYFRGEQGMKALVYLKENFDGPSDFLAKMYRPTYSELMKAFSVVPSYGPYHIWKIQDFYDRILGLPVIPDTCIDHIPNEPLKGMALVLQEVQLEAYTTEEAFAYMERSINTKSRSVPILMAPPIKDRAIDIREIETAMCMLKHYYNGTDYVGKDLLDKYESLEGYGPVADILRKHIPPPVPRDYFSPPADVLLKLGIKKAKETPHPVKQEPSVDLFAAFGG